MNYAHFAGRLGHDASLRSTPDGKPVLNFSLAVDTGWGDRKETLWVDCTLWGERGEKLAPHLSKGKAVTIAGDVGLRTWDKRDGSAGVAITCNVQRLTLQGGGSSGEPASSGAEFDWKAAEQREAAKPRPIAALAAGQPSFDDDIPF